jgi:HD-like signal output (HDOD) protein
MTDVESLNLKICKIKNLPELPAASIKIINAISDPDIAIEELASVISISPVLTARLLGLANSAYFGRTDQLIDLKTAIIRVLGLNLVKSLALGVLLNLSLNTSKCTSFKSEKLWMNALVTATLGNKLSLLIRDSSFTPSTSYTAGLLLNIGLIAAVHLFPEQIEEVLKQAEEKSSSINVEMTNLIGHNQFDIGGLLLEHWHLPDFYQIVLKEFKNNSYSGSETKFICFMTVCYDLAKKILADDEEGMSSLISELENYDLTTTAIRPIISDISAKKDNIYLAALAISGK